MILDPVDYEAPPPDAPDHSGELVAVGRDHGLRLTVVDRLTGPTITRYRLHLAPGVHPDKVARLVPLWTLATGVQVRFVGPPEETTCSVEVPNVTRSVVQLGQVLDVDRSTPAFPVVPFGIGVDTNPVRTPLWKLPHMLVAGATGQGKSVYLNAVLVALLAQCGPDALRLAMIDPKRVELTPYARLPHLVAPIATSAGEAIDVLAAVVETMDARYREMTDAGAREFDGPSLVVVADEFADLMLDKDARKVIEPMFVRIAQVGRAARVHLILATQYPKADVVTPLIKQNIPTRVAFRTMDHTSSNVVLNRSGAELLAGHGDGMVLMNGAARAHRFQAPLVSDDELVRAVAAWERHAPPAVTPEPYVPSSQHAAAVAAAQAAAHAAREQVASSAPAPVVSAPPSVADEMRAEVLAQARSRVPLLEERIAVLETALAVVLETLSDNGIQLKEALS